MLRQMAVLLLFCVGIFGQDTGAGATSGDSKPLPNSYTPPRTLLIHKVEPKYPRSARKNHVEGTVVLHAVISKEGRIADLRFVSGPQELAQAAMSAVKQWRYRPFLLNGEARALNTTVEVKFALNR